MRRMTSFMIAAIVLLTSAASPALAMSAAYHLVRGSAIIVHAPQQPGPGSTYGTGMRLQRFVSRPSPVLPDSRKSCYRHRLRQLLQLGHDYDLAQEEALLICG